MSYQQAFSSDFELQTKVVQPRWMRVQQARKHTTCVGDRFIPNRSSMNVELSQLKISSENTHEDGSRILAFKDKAPERASEDLRYLYQTKPVHRLAEKRPSTRIIPSQPERVLDAPDVLDDYYLNLLDWSSCNILSVALNSTVFLWNATTGGVEELLNLGENEYVSSVRSMPDGTHLAVGTSNGTVQLWDVQAMKKVRTMGGQGARIPSLSWNRHTLSSGCRDGSIFHHDVRIAKHHTGTLEGHSQEVCGLQWSPDGSQLASGGNDNLLCIWDQGKTEPKFVKSQHKAAVKALAWCPWQSSLLASGGGSYDRTIRFWNTENGHCLSSHDTGSQVCGLSWNAEYREIISSHGFVDNQLSIWKYPSMTKVTDLIAHSSRILHMAMSPDGQSVVTIAADENLKFWKCFESKKSFSSLNSHPKTESKLRKVLIR